MWSMIFLCEIWSHHHSNSKAELGIIARTFRALYHEAVEFYMQAQVTVELGCPK